MKPKPTTRKRIHVTVSDSTVHILNTLAREKGDVGIGHSVDFLVEHWKKTCILGCHEEEFAEMVAERVVRDMRERGVL